LPGTGKNVVMKVFWPGAGYRFSRRINILLRNMIGGEARRAFYGALKLEQAGIPSVGVLAHWTYRRSLFGVEGYLMYEEIAAEKSLRDLALEAYVGKDPRARAELAALISPLAKLVSSLHACGLSHDDLATGNFLLTGDSGNENRLVLLDTERIKVRREPFRLLKRTLDLNDLRRFNLDEDLRRRFLRLYMGDAYSETWWKVLEFWRRVGNRPVRTIVRLATGRRDTARKDGT
jgi:tRNA A-37 threonylcarbamoyl transferase component Bud32